MSYVDQRMGSGRFASIIIVAVLHALLGYALVTGMAYNAVKQAVEDLKTFDVKEPPPPDEPPPPPEKIEVQPPPIVAPPPIVRIETPMPQPQVQIVPVAPQPVITVKPPPPPEPKRPVPVRGDLRKLFSADDYPESALRAEQQGTVRVSLSVGPNGKVAGCSVTQSSGSSALDNATCSIIRRKASFTPATDESGAAVSSTYPSPPITWRLPKD